MPRIQRRLFEGKDASGRHPNGWRKGTDVHIKTEGKFAERLAQHVLGGVRSEANDNTCDLWCAERDLGMESKAGSSQDGVKIPESQLEAHLQSCGDEFPYAHCWYVLLKYRNAKRYGDFTQRLFQEEVRCEADVSPFLCRNTTGLYVLDISVVEAIRKCRGADVTIWRDHSVQPATKIRWRFFSQLAAAPDNSLHSLGLSPKRYRLESRRIQTEFDGGSMEFDFLLLLSRKSFKRMAAPTLFPMERQAAIA